jgi:hypothetical protein
MMTKETSVVVRFDVVNIIDTIYELRDGSGLVWARRSLASGGVFTARSPTIFKESELIMGRRVGENLVVGQRWTAAPAAALHRKSLRNNSLESKIALDAIPRASHSIGLVWRHHSPPSRRGNCVNAGPVSRSEFTRTTSSHGSTAS